MGIATDILGLRHHHLSSVAELLAALEQVRDAPVGKILARVFLAGEARLMDVSRNWFQDITAEHIHFEFLRLPSDLEGVSENR